jgi:polysaccharide pyruvyl transferase WcaK-like protein
MNIKTQFENVGDALIIRELLRQIASRSRLIVDVSRCPEAFRSSIGLSELPNTTVRAAGFISIATSMLSDRLRGDRPYYFLIPGGINGEKSTKQYWFALAGTVGLAILSTLGARICQTGISYEALGDRHKRLLRRRLRYFYKAMVRDELSLMYARKNRIRADGIVPDLAFALKPLDGVVAERTKVAFSFRADKSPETRDVITRRVLEICQTISQDTPVLFVVQVARDATFMKNLKCDIEKKLQRSIEYVEQCSDIDECRLIYSKCTHLFSNRLHGLLLALCSGAKSVPLIDPFLDTKIVGVFEQAGWADAILDANVLTSNGIQAALSDPFRLNWSDQMVSISRFFDEIYDEKLYKLALPND